MKKSSRQAAKVKSELENQLPLFGFVVMAGGVIEVAVEIALGWIKIITKDSVRIIPPGEGEGGDHVWKERR